MGDEVQSSGELTPRSCWERLRGEAYGRLAVTDEDGPMMYAVNAVVEHGTIVFRTAPGSKLDAIRADPRVAFEVDGADERSGLAWSVVVRGRARELLSVDDVSAVTELGVTPWQAGAKPVYVRIDPASIAGREFARIEPTDG